MSRFSGKVVLVTGSSSGIGLATALLFAREGARVTVNGRNEERLEESRRSLLDAGIPESDLNVVPADVTTEAGRDLLISSTVEKFGRLDVLVNNAGSAIPDVNGRKRTAQGVDTYQKYMNVYVESVISLTQKARAHLKLTKGDVVNVSAAVASCPVANVNNPYFSTAKAALNQYTRSSAIDLISDGIRVNSVSPGVVASGFARAAGWDEAAAREFYENVGKHPECIPQRVCGKPDDIAKVIAFLADRNASSYIVGQNIIADGGTSLILGFHAHLMAEAQC